jgi:hypothetical protein
MPTSLQFRRGTDTQNDAFTGAAGELSIDTTNKTIRVHDGSTAGGSRLATYADVLGGGLDSTAVINLIDSAYVQAREAAGGGAGGVDSTAVSVLIDSALTAASGVNFDPVGTDNSTNVTLAGSYDYLTLSGQQITLNQVDALQDISNLANIATTGDWSDVLNGPTSVSYFSNDAGYTTYDSTSFNSQLDSAVGTSVQAFLVSGTNIKTINGSSLLGSGNITISGDGSGTVDSATVSTLIDSALGAGGYLDSTTVLGVINASYIQANQITYSTADFPDSAGVITLINENAGTGTVDSATVSSLIDSALAAGGYLDSATVLGVVDPTYIQANQLTYDFLLDSAEALALFSGGTGVTYNGSGQFSIGQAVGTSDSPTFNGMTLTGNLIVAGDLQVTGTTTTVNSEDLNVTDNMIYMNAGESSGSPTVSIDVGWAANVNDDGSYQHVGLFRDATDNTFKVFEGYTPEPDAAVEINTGHASFGLAPFAARTLTGKYLGIDSDLTAASGVKFDPVGTDNSTNVTLAGSYDYLTLSGQQITLAQIDASTDISGLATVATTGAYANLSGTPTTVSTFTNDANYLDSTTVQDVIDTTYVQSNQITYTTADFPDSAGVTTLANAAITSATGSSILAYDANLQSFVTTFTLPTSDGTTGQVLQTNGSGTLSFADAGGGGFDAGKTYTYSILFGG